VHAGLHGLRYPGDRDFLPEEELRQVVNLHDFAGMLVFGN
jgi:hypothetical protein